MTDQPEPWTASISALGPITQETPLTVEALAPLLPGYLFEELPAPDDAPDNPFIRARRKDTDAAALEFIGHRETGTVVTVRVFEPGRIANAFMIGSKFSDTLLKRDRCFRGEGEVAAYVSCAMADEPWLLYWLRTPADDVPADAAISFISWIPWRAPDEAAT